MRARENASLTKYCDVWAYRLTQSTHFAKKAEIRARRERRGFPDGSLLCVNEQGKTQV